MRVRKRLRRIKRLAYLGALVGVAYALRQAKAKRDARTTLGPPATWPPLEVAEQPVAALGDLVTDAAPPGADGSPAEQDPPSGEAQAVTSAATSAPVVSDEPVAAIGDIAADERTWVEPDADGACPVAHPVKANDNSGIYHVPGGPFYERTRPERCYVDAAAAEADGYRAAKGS